MAGVEGIRTQQRGWLAQQLLHRAEELSRQLDRDGLEPLKPELPRVAVAENLRVRILQGGQVVFDSGRLRGAFHPGRALVHGPGISLPGPWDAMGSELAQAAQEGEGWQVTSLPPENALPEEPAQIAHLLVAVSGRQGTVHLSRSLLDYEAELAETRFLLIEAALALALLAAVLSFFLTRAILRPLARLNQAAGRLARGEWTTRAGSSSRDEVGALGCSFDHLAAELQRREELLRRFSADAAHELKTPIASLKALTDALMAGASEEPAEARRFAELMGGELGRLESLVADLTELHRLEGGPPLHRERQQMTPIVTKTVEAFSRSWPEIDLEVKTVEVLADVDGGRIRQILTNLLENSRCALAGTSEPKISLELVAVSGELQISVTDNGPGIPESELENIFERFHRIKMHRSRKEGGSGLGLAICRSIAEAHGGRIWAERAPGSTRVIIALPTPETTKPP